MKLNLLFIAMYLFSVLVYPVVFIHSKICQFTKSREVIILANILVTDSVAPGE